MAGSEDAQFRGRTCEVTPRKQRRGGEKRAHSGDISNIGKEGVEDITKVCDSGGQGFAAPLIKRQGGEDLRERRKWYQPEQQMRVKTWAQLQCAASPVWGAGCLGAGRTEEWTGGKGQSASVGLSSRKLTGKERAHQRRMVYCLLLSIVFNGKDSSETKAERLWVWPQGSQGTSSKSFLCHYWQLTVTLPVNPWVAVGLEGCSWTHSPALHHYHIPLPGLPFNETLLCLSASCWSHARHEGHSPQVQVQLGWATRRKAWERGAVR